MYRISKFAERKCNCACCAKHVKELSHDEEWRFLNESSTIAYGALVENYRRESPYAQCTIQLGNTARHSRHIQNIMTDISGNDIEAIEKHCDKYAKFRAYGYM